MRVEIHKFPQVGGAITVEYDNLFKLLIIENTVDNSYIRLYGAEIYELRESLNHILGQLYVP